ncbi:hypothetical protein [Corynebacterium mastitidis]|uniref:hypothetical protein n=1 Tax=Corynebacterium mastitidis TaxID=161890 RepID=UPI0012E9FA3C|nr:hypothetical protein [Corynebacterium mastitidis]
MVNIDFLGAVLIFFNSVLLVITCFERWRLSRTSARLAHAPLGAIPGALLGAWTHSKNRLSQINATALGFAIHGIAIGLIIHTPHIAPVLVTILALITSCFLLYKAQKNLAQEEQALHTLLEQE